MARRWRAAEGEPQVPYSPREDADEPTGAPR
jgi:hypothetical protein